MQAGKVAKPGSRAVLIVMVRVHRTNVIHCGFTTMDITQTNVMDGGPACQAGCIARERLQGIRDATSFCHQIYGRDWMRRTFSKLKSLCGISNGSYGRGVSTAVVVYARYK